MALSGNAIRRICAAKGYILIEGNIIPDLCGFPDDREPMINEETLADARAWMNVVSGKKPGKMIDGTRQEIKPRAIKAMRDPMKSERPNTRIKEDFSPGTWSWITGFDRVQIADKIAQHAAAPENRRVIHKATAKFFPDVGYFGF
jgi:hypothetical protein